MLMGVTCLLWLILIHNLYPAPAALKCFVDNQELLTTAGLDQLLTTQCCHLKHGLMNMMNMMNMKNIMNINELNEHNEHDEQDE